MKECPWIVVMPLERQKYVEHTNIFTWGFKDTTLVDRPHSMLNINLQSINMLKKCPIVKVGECVVVVKIQQSADKYSELDMTISVSDVYYTS